MLPSEIASKLEDLVSRSQEMFGKCPCLLCGINTLSRGVFCPQEPDQWGGIKSKTRVFSYPICNSCIEEADWDRVEKIIREEFVPEWVIQ